MTTESAYPEHEKMAAVRGRSEPAGELLEWLFSQGVSLMIWKETKEPVGGGVVRRFEGFVSYSSNIQQILADWLGIDLDKIEREKRAMLASLAEANGRGA